MRTGGTHYPALRNIRGAKRARGRSHTHTHVHSRTHASNVEFASPRWFKHRTRVGNEVLQRSADMLRVGGNGEAILRTRQHDAYHDLLPHLTQRRDVNAFTDVCREMLLEPVNDQIERVMSSMSDPLEVAEAYTQQHNQTHQHHHILSFTIVDVSYGDMLGEVWHMMHRLKVCAVCVM